MRGGGLKFDRKFEKFPKVEKFLILRFKLIRRDTTLDLSQKAEQR